MHAVTHSAHDLASTMLILFYTYRALFTQ